MHALSAGQSDDRTHSGRQPSYGFPWYPSIQRQAPTPFRWIHSAFDEHGLGSHGLIGVGCSTTHWTNGLPVYGGGHTHETVWPITWPNEIKVKLKEIIQIRNKSNISLIFQLTFCICSTRSFAWILTFIIYTSQLRRTISIEHTFWSTIGWWADVSTDALARWSFTKCLTHRIRTAGITWILAWMQ